MASTSVVIPVYDNWEGCHALLFDLYKNCSLIEEVIIVNDASPSSEVMKGLNWWKSTNMLPIHIIDLKDNLGFLKASNLGLKEAGEEVVCLISTDVRVRGDIIKSLHVLDTLSYNWLAGGRLYNASTGWNDFDGKVFNYLEGWLLATRNTAWRDLGYFDERYVPCDFEDVDISTTALSKDYVLHSLELDCPLEHGGGHSIKYGEEREKITNANRLKFREKWLG